jgi:hypothetical protein
VTDRFPEHLIYLHGSQFHSSNECDVQFLGACGDDMRRLAEIVAESYKPGWQLAIYILTAIIIVDSIDAAPVRTAEGVTTRQAESPSAHTDSGCLVQKCE